jgi:SPP1 family predicted phage head-tail adaptor
MQASELRHIIKFQSATTSADGMGGKTASEWVTDRTTRAKIVSTGADTVYEINKSRGVKSFVIMTRYLKDYEITKKTRVLWGTRILTPNVPVNIDTLQIWMTFEATEQTD